MTTTYAPPPKNRVSPRAGALAAAIACAIPLVAVFEGEREVGYLDIVNVPTYCFGGTGPSAVVGKVYTKAECQTQLSADVQRYAQGLARCITVDVPTPSFAALISLSYNIGVAGECNTSVFRPTKPGKPPPVQGLIWKLNHGDLAGACGDISKFNTSNHRVIRGLTIRRTKERALCESGLK